METKKEYLQRENNRCHYDRKLIFDVVKLVEDGMPRKEANESFKKLKILKSDKMKKSIVNKCHF